MRVWVELETFAREADWVHGVDEAFVLSRFHRGPGVRSREGRQLRLCALREMGERCEEDA